MSKKKAGEVESLSSEPEKSLYVQFSEGSISSVSAGVTKTAKMALEASDSVSVGGSKASSKAQPVSKMIDEAEGGSNAVFVETEPNNPTNEPIEEPEIGIITLDQVLSQKRTLIARFHDHTETVELECSELPDLAEIIKQATFRAALIPCQAQQAAPFIEKNGEYKASIPYAHVNYSLLQMVDRIFDVKLGEQDNLGQVVIDFLSRCRGIRAAEPLPDPDMSPMSLSYLPDPLRPYVMLFNQPGFHRAFLTSDFPEISIAVAIYSMMRIVNDNKFVVVLCGDDEKTQEFEDIVKGLRNPNNAIFSCNTMTKPSTNQGFSVSRFQETTPPVFFLVNHEQFHLWQPEDEKQASKKIGLILYGVQHEDTYSDDRYMRLFEKSEKTIYIEQPVKHNPKKVNHEHKLHALYKWSTGESISFQHAMNSMLNFDLRVPYLLKDTINEVRSFIYNPLVALDKSDVKYLDSCVRVVLDPSRTKCKRVVFITLDERSIKTCKTTLPSRLASLPPTEAYQFVDFTSNQVDTIKRQIFDTKHQGNASQVVILADSRKIPSCLFGYKIDSIVFVGQTPITMREVPKGFKIYLKGILTLHKVSVYHYGPESVAELFTRFCSPNDYEWTIPGVEATSMPQDWDIDGTVSFQKYRGPVRLFPREFKERGAEGERRDNSRLTQRSNRRAPVERPIRRRIQPRLSIAPIPVFIPVTPRTPPPQSPPVKAKTPTRERAVREMPQNSSTPIRPSRSNQTDSAKQALNKIVNIDHNAKDTSKPPPLQPILKLNNEISPKTEDPNAGKRSATIRQKSTSKEPTSEMNIPYNRPEVLTPKFGVLPKEKEHKRTLSETKMRDKGSKTPIRNADESSSTRVPHNEALKAVIEQSPVAIYSTSRSREKAQKLINDMLLDGIFASGERSALPSTSRKSRDLSASRDNIKSSSRKGKSKIEAEEDVSVSPRPTKATSGSDNTRYVLEVTFDDAGQEMHFYCQTQIDLLADLQNTSKTHIYSKEVQEVLRSIVSGLGQPRKVKVAYNTLSIFFIEFIDACYYFKFVKGNNPWRIMIESILGENRPRNLQLTRKTQEQHMANAIAKLPIRVDRIPTHLSSLVYWLAKTTLPNYFIETDFHELRMQVSIIGIAASLVQTKLGVIVVDESESIQDWESYLRVVAFDRATGSHKFTVVHVQKTNLTGFKIVAGVSVPVVYILKSSDLAAWSSSSSLKHASISLILHKITCVQLKPFQDLIAASAKTIFAEGTKKYSSKKDMVLLPKLSRCLPNLKVSDPDRQIMLKSLLTVNLTQMYMCSKLGSLINILSSPNPQESLEETEPGSKYSSHGESKLTTTEIKSLLSQLLEMYCINAARCKIAVWVFNKNHQETVAESVSAFLVKHNLDQVVHVHNALQITSTQQFVAYPSIQSPTESGSGPLPPSLTAHLPEVLLANSQTPSSVLSNFLPTVVILLSPRGFPSAFASYLQSQTLLGMLDTVVFVDSHPKLIIEYSQGHEKNLWREDLRELHPQVSLVQLGKLRAPRFTGMLRLWDKTEVPRRIPTDNLEHRAALAKLQERDHSVSVEIGETETWTGSVVKSDAASTFIPVSQMRLQRPAKLDPTPILPSSSSKQPPKTPREATGGNVTPVKLSKSKQRLLEKSVEPSSSRPRNRETSDFITNEDEVEEISDVGFDQQNLSSSSGVNFDLQPDETKRKLSLRSLRIDNGNRKNLLANHLLMPKPNGTSPNIDELMREYKKKRGRKPKWYCEQLKIMKERQEAAAASGAPVTRKASATTSGTLAPVAGPIVPSRPYLQKITETLLAPRSVETLERRSEEREEKKPQHIETSERKRPPKSVITRVKKDDDSFLGKRKSK